MLFMAASAKPMILTLIGEKWLPSVSYLQLLCFAGMLYPLHAMNLNMLKVKGRSDLFLRLEIIKKALAVPVILIGIFIGIHAMIVGMIFNSFIAYYLNSYYSGRLINYPVKEQIRDILPSFSLAMVTGIIIFIPSVIFTVKPLLMLLIQIISGLIIVVLISELKSIFGYMEIKSILFEKVSQKFMYGQKKQY